MNNIKDNKLENNVNNNLNDNNQKIDEIIGEYKYGFKTETENVYNTGKGLTLDIVTQISKYKGEPQWMLEIRQKAFKAFEKIPNPEMET